MPKICTAMATGTIRAQVGGYNFNYTTRSRSSTKGRVKLGHVKIKPGHTGPSNAKTTNKAQCSAIWIGLTGPECVGERCARPLHPPGGVGGAVRGEPIIIKDTVPCILSVDRPEMCWNRHKVKNAKLVCHDSGVVMEASRRTTMYRVLKTHTLDSNTSLSHQLYL